MALRIVTAHCQLLSCALQEWLSSLRSTADTSLRLGLATDTWRTDPSPVLPHCTSHEQSSHCTTVWLSQVQLLLTIVETQPWVSKTRQKQRKSTVPMAFFLEHLNYGWNYYSQIVSYHQWGQWHQPPAYWLIGSSAAEWEKTGKWRHRGKLQHWWSGKTPHFHLSMGGSKRLRDIVRRFRNWKLSTVIDSLLHLQGHTSLPMHVWTARTGYQNVVTVREIKRL